LFFIVEAIALQGAFGAFGVARAAECSAVGYKIKMQLKDVERQFKIEKQLMGFLSGKSVGYQPQALTDAMHMGIDWHDVSPQGEKQDASHGFGANSNE
jgi:hypothetical protein